jgi:FMN reductase
MSEGTTDGIRIVAITGSVRPGNYTSMALRLVVDELSRHDKVRTEYIDPATLDLAPPGIDLHRPDATALRGKVAAATGVVLATPEYHGSFSSVIKLVIENLGFPSALAGKPVALLGVAHGAIAVSVANVQQVFDASGKCLDATVEKRVRRAGTGLLDYIHGAICPRVALEAMVRAGAA